MAYYPKKNTNNFGENGYSEASYACDQNSMEAKYAEVTLSNAARKHYYDPKDLELEVGQWVVVESSRGMEIGQVSNVKTQLPESYFPESFNSTDPQKKHNFQDNSKKDPEDDYPGSKRSLVYPILRIATDDDFAKTRLRNLQSSEAGIIAKDMIAASNLPMKLLDTFITLDGNKIVFEFVAPDRVDFRELVSNLARQFQKRIELHQVGTRDRSILVGGLGVCGRELCCSNWRKRFSTISLKMSKAQGLSISPNKISGSCGRLMCCLEYEYPSYHEFQNKLPQVGETVTYNEKNYEVTCANLMRKTITLKVADNLKGADNQFLELSEDKGKLLKTEHQSTAEANLGKIFDEAATVVKEHKANFKPRSRLVKTDISTLPKESKTEKELMDDQKEQDPDTNNNYSL